MRLDIVVPCFDEAEALPETHRQLAALLAGLRASGAVAAESRILYVDDGSRDDTWRIIRALAEQSPDVRGLRLSRNCGHQLALLAGLAASGGDAVVSIDADLQDDLAVVPEMVRQFRDGHDIVFGVRRQRDADPPFKRWTARLYYRLLGRLGVRVVPDHADFRLMSRRAVAGLLQFSEVNVFLRGLVPLLGYRTCNVYYDRRPRTAGTTKYNLRRMVLLALDGISSFSSIPLRLVSLAGFLVFLASIGMIAWVLWIRLSGRGAVPGWASSVIPIYFLGGIQLLSLGVLGEYVAKIYMESKRRPRYFVAETAGQ